MPTENIDPVSGNEIPPGSLPQEVRDDVDAKLSEGEYVLPADVVRYFGLDYIEKLINKAKQGMEELQAGGRIGGKTEEDLPFSPEELQAHEAEMASGPPQMAVGGLVPSAGSVTDETNRGPVDPVTGLPWWQLQQKQQEQAPVKAPVVESWMDKQSMRQPTTGLAASIDKWAPKDFITYANTKGNAANRMVEAGISTLIPMGGLALKARQKYLDKGVPTQLDTMISTGKDSQGNPLSQEDLTALKDARTKIGDTSTQTKEKGGLGGVISKGLKSLFGGSETKSASTPTKTTTKPTTKSTPTKSSTTKALGLFSV